jgi:prolyl oligopeptidase
LYFHKLGTPQLADELIYEDKTNPARSFGAFTTEDERYTFLNLFERAKGVTGNAIWYLPPGSATNKFIPIIPEPGRFSYNFVREYNGRFYFHTNDGAPNFKLVSIDPAHPERENWKTVIPEKDEPLTGVNNAGGKMFAGYTKDVLSHYYVYDANGNAEGEVKPPALGMVSGLNGRADDTFVFYSLYSMVTPPVTYKYDLATRKSSVYLKPEIKYNPDDFIMEQRFYTSKDGTKIPAFICYKKGLKKDGQNPAILYGYGGFSVTSSPNFSATRITWLEQGGVYCLANLRGGNEYGEKWHEAGMLLNKQNVFDDFIAAAEFLAKEKYTSKEYLAVQGGSNGGLLVGAVINQRPDICRVAIPQVGVMDMLRYHRFTIGSAWINEYGSSDQEAHFRNLYKFSPTHNIKEGINYPAVLVTTADHDDRVVPGHSFKYTATLQEKYKGPNPAFIRVDVNSGHGASSTQKGYELLADVYSFIFYNMKKTPVFWLEKKTK